MNWWQWILVIASGTCLGVLASNIALAVVITLKQRKLQALADDFQARESGSLDWDPPYQAHNTAGWPEKTHISDKVASETWTPPDAS